MPEVSRTDLHRLQSRLAALATIGASEGGGITRLALGDADREARQLVLGLMRELELEIRVDRVGNVFGIRPGIEEGPVVMMGSHLDTVRDGGPLDGSYGVLAGLEVLRTLDDAGIRTRRPLAVAVFTNEEGLRYAPDMMGSLVFAGGLDLDQALATVGEDGSVFGRELERIGFAGPHAPGSIPVHRYLELHVEQGPVLDDEHAVIGIVEGVQGISWTEILIEGEANHAGTTPLRRRRDAGYAAACVARYVRDLAQLEIGGDQLATCGVLELEPGAVNVVPARARLTVDLRNSRDDELKLAERFLDDFLSTLEYDEQVRTSTRRLARTEPVAFDADLVGLVEEVVTELDYPCRRMISGAGHDAQWMARVCPSAMIFVPSLGGVSHSPREATNPEHLEAGANVLLEAVLRAAD
jgi:N-carbamoyl-L-amino-acid hydrolase